MEILAGDDVRRRLRPALRYFHVFLAEDRHALLVPNQRRALLPFDRVERRLLPVGKIPLEGQTFPLAARCLLCGCIRGSGFPVQCMLHCSHPPLLPPGPPPPPRGAPSY